MAGSDNWSQPVSPETSAGLGAVTQARSSKLRSRHVTMITLGGIIGASLFVGSGNVIREVGPAAIVSYLIGGLQFVFGLSLFRGAPWAWWFVVLGSLVPIGTHVLGGLRGEPWGWGTIFWNLLVLAYMQSRDVQGFFGREAY